MPKFRKKPVEVEARIFTAQTAEAVAAWCDGSIYQRYFFGKPQTKVLEIKTLEGTVEATEGYWIIKGVHGEFYPCKPDIFEETYEALDV